MGGEANAWALPATREGTIGKELTLPLDTRFLRLPILATRFDELGALGFHFREVMVALVIVLSVLLGVLETLTTASVADLGSHEATASQVLLDRTIDEVNNAAYEDLLSIPARQVSSGTNHASIQAQLVTTDLIRVQVNVASTAFPDVTNSAVILVANPR